MRGFDRIEVLGNGKVRARGEFDWGAARFIRLTFVLAQDGVMVEGEGKVSGNLWFGETEGGGLQVDKPVVAVGIGVSVEGPSVQSITWCEQHTVMQGG
jgi:hypothetical protein